MAKRYDNLDKGNIKTVAEKTPPEYGTHTKVEIESGNFILMERTVPKLDQIRMPNGELKAEFVPLIDRRFMPADDPKFIEKKEARGWRRVQEATSRVDSVSIDTIPVDDEGKPRRGRRATA